MALNDKRVAKVQIKFDGDVFYEIWKSLQLHIPSFTPTTIQNVRTLGGEVGIVGVVLLWNFFLDGEDRLWKTQIVEIDGENKSVTYKLLEGYLTEQYDYLLVNVHVKTDGSDSLVTWTAEYEKLSPDVPDPDTLMDLFRQATKDIEAHLQEYFGETRT